MFVIYIAFAALLLIGADLKGLSGWQEDFLSLKTTKALQGFFAIGVILHHLSQRVGNLEFFIHAGVYAVGFFFFCSGYGIIKSLQIKENYLNNFLKKRLPVVMIPFYVTSWLYMMSMLFLDDRKYGLGDYLGMAVGLRLANSHTWYIVAIIIFYLGFYLNFQLLRNRRMALVFMGFFVVGYTVMGLYLAHGEFLVQKWFSGQWWYNSAGTFFIGMLIARFEQKLLPVIKKFYIWYLTGGIALFVALHKAVLYTQSHYSVWNENSKINFFDYTNQWICLAACLPAVIVFVLVVFLIGMKLQCKGRMLDFLGKISLELYLIHAMFLNGLRSGGIYIQNDLLYVGLTVICSVLAAVLIHALDEWLIRLFYRIFPVNSKNMNFRVEKS